MFLSPASSPDIIHTAGLHKLINKPQAQYGQVYMYTYMYTKMCHVCSCVRSEVTFRPFLNLHYNIVSWKTQNWWRFQFFILWFQCRHYSTMHMKLVKHFNCKIQGWNFIFHFTKRASICKSYSLWETFEGALRLHSGQWRQQCLHGPSLISDLCLFSPIQNKMWKQKVSMGEFRKGTKEQTIKGKVHLW